MVKRNAQRQKKLLELGLLANGNSTFFEEATQIIARNLGLPICLASLMVEDEILINSAVGMCSLGLANSVVFSRRISRSDAYCTLVVDSAMPLMVTDALTEPFFAEGELCQHYGIRAYLGTPLLTRDGICLGALAVLGFSPHRFTEQDLALLNMTARWCMGEIECQAHLNGNNSNIHQSDNSSAQLSPIAVANHQSASVSEEKFYPKEESYHSPEAVKLQLVPYHLSRIQRDLTSIIGMASVVNSGVFGELNEKQKQYLEIIHQSGQRIGQAIEEILEMERIRPDRQGLRISNVNLELLGEYWRDKMATILSQNQLNFNLSLESGLKYWPLDRVKVRQGIYYLLLSLLGEGITNGTLRIQASSDREYLHFSVWADYPQIALQDLLIPGTSHGGPLQEHPEENQGEVIVPLTLEHLALKLQGHSQENQGHHCQRILALILSFYFIKSHQGKIFLQGSDTTGYYYLVQWPAISSQISTNHGREKFSPSTPLPI
ncbi:GAF domain-containing protein [Synechocystis sp. PCC 6714]|uniref:GAF domain-containing protein n=2 Tax=unclassified Synechocystis TaxID=2640012 RepID=UPI0004270B8C|nr:GAF domain-containing protein [Synechocystis sp. PCC 6714]